MFRFHWLTSLKDKLRAHHSRNRGTRRRQNHHSHAQFAQTSVSRFVTESLEDRTLLTAFTVVNNNDSGTGSLRDAIELANANTGADTILFDAALTGQVFSFTEKLTISDDLSIIGLGADQLTLQVNGGSESFFSLFYIGDNDYENHFSVDISGLAFEGVGTGRAIYSSERLIVTDCQFSELYGETNGGAIYAQRYLTVNRSSFLNNKTDGSGGGIYYSNTSIDSQPDFQLIVLHSYFYENEATLNGGGLYVGARDLGYGGVYNDYPGLTLSSSIFTRNACSASGGGVAVINGWMNISDSIFTSNSADRGGGVCQQLLSDYENTKTATKISSCDFTANSARYGGGGFYHATWLNAIYQLNNFEKEITFDSCKFGENTADSRGGGLYLNTLVLGVEISNTSISYNSSGEEGGGIFSSVPHLIVNNCVLDNNSAYEVGGAFFLYNNLTIHGSTISNNSAGMRGGAFYTHIQESEIRIHRCTVISNSAGESGGGIYATTLIGFSINAIVSNSIMAGNVASKNAQATLGSDFYSSIIQENVEGLLDPVLRDNGGATKTHALIPGSSAIDAGTYDASADDIDQWTDQRGSGFVRVVGNGIDIGAFEVQGPFTQVDLRIVNSKTATQSNGESSLLPDNLAWIDEWSGYWLEIWISTPTTTELGILSAALDLNYNTAITTATSIEYSSAFTLNQTGTINDVTGTIENLSAETSQTDVGDDQHVLFARIRFESTSDDAVNLDLQSQSLNPQSPEFSIGQPEVIFVGGSPSEEVHGSSPETQIWANPYDLNDDDTINFRDLMLFASVYSTIPSESSSNYSWFADLNQSNSVNFRDLLFFATNYGKSKLAHSTIVYPQNFPDTWNNQLLVDTTQGEPQLAPAPLSQSAADQVLDSVVQHVSPQLTPSQNETLENIDIQVVDLEGDTLGRAVSGTIYIDANAAGYGWFVDATPGEHSEFEHANQLSLIALPDTDAAGRLDLWSVIMHELGHILGSDHEEDGLMQDTLAPGTRKLPSWEWNIDLENNSMPEEADSFFLTIQDETELVSF